jgi:hypothetical protein
MISGISSSSSYLTVAGGMPSTPYISPGSQSAGMMRWNTNTKLIEVYDGISWISLHGSHATVDLNAHAQSLLRWVEEKMRRELELQKLAEDNPSVATAIKNLKTAEDQLELISALAKKHTEVNG